MPAVRQLREVDPASEALFGGKAAGLARLLARGARVPEGFAVAAGRQAPDDWPEAEKAAFRAAAAALLAGGAVAVRSSAVGEDSAERSFAGQLETVLGLTTPEAAWAAASRCLASGSGERVVAYGGGSLAVGLVVQRQVAARSAGVCFTVDPLGRDRAALVEAVAGTGEALVAGRSEAELWRVHRSGLGGWEPRPAPRPGPPVLTPAQAAEVAGNAAELARGEGRPLDLEWAFDAEGRLWWLQMRPVTSWIPAREWRVERSLPGARDGPVTVWSNWNVRETMPEPLHPLCWGLWREVLMPMSLGQLTGVDVRRPTFRDLQALDLVQGRIYFNLNGLLAIPGLGALTPRVLRQVDARAAATLEALRREGVLTPRRTRLGAPAALLAAGLRVLTRLPLLLRPRHALRALDAEARALETRPPLASLGDRDLLDEMGLLAGPGCRTLRDGLHLEAVAMLLYDAATRAFAFSPEAAGLLTAGVEGPTTALSLALEDLAEAALSLAPLFEEGDSGEVLARLERDEGGRAWLGGLRSFLDEFGHRAPGEFDLGVPRWSEDPGMVVELVRARLRSPGEALRERLPALRERRNRAILSAVRTRSVWRRPWLRFLTRALELYMPLREAPKHHGMRAFRRMRGAALELGRRLLGRGLLAHPADVFFLAWEEAAALAGGGGAPDDLRARVERRRAEHADDLLHPAPDFVRSDGVPVAEDLPVSHEEGLLHGVPTSAGRATGPVRLLEQPDPRRVQAGDVLVVTFADPGWTPLFLRAAAVVMEVGGTMCHAAVVAREMGVPAVFGVRDATRLLPEGAIVEVDGRAGTVRLQAAVGTPGAAGLGPGGSGAGLGLDPRR